MSEPTAVDHNDRDEEKDTNDYATQPKSKGAPKSRKPKQPAGKAHGQKTLAEILNPSVAVPGSTLDAENQPEAKHEISVDHEEQGRRKRPRTNSCNAHGNGSDDVPAESHTRLEELPIAESNPPRAQSPFVAIPPPATDEGEAKQPAPPPAEGGTKTPPKKMMKLNAGGKLSSPGAKSKEDGKQSDTETRRRGRPRKAKEPPPPKSRIVIFHYGKECDSEQRRLRGQQLDRILAGEERIPQPVATQKKSKTTKKAKPAKSTHPFFTGKPEVKPAMKLESPRKASASTPGKLRSQAFHDRISEPSKEIPYAIGSALLKDRLMVKHPGAREPLWPDRMQAHVRGIDDDFRPRCDPQQPSKRKRKQLRHHIHPDESILNIFAAQLAPEPEPEQHADGFAGPRHDLRLPKKLLITGDDVRGRILQQIRAPIWQEDEDELVGIPASQRKVHPAVQKVYDALPNQLSAFDNCKGEVQGWTFKYAPTTAQDVLQPSNKMNVLKEWLQSLTINAVEAVPSTKLELKPSTKPKKKRRRQNDELDDFLVDDDTDVQEVSFIPETFELDETTSKHQLKSTVQSSNGSKVSNAVLLSGPHGCGKTASAYAVAKELGFQIFEISSAERRSGRDVVDRVGDMTENHIVRHHGVESGEISASEDGGHIEAAFQKDLESGRQGKMSAFFKSQPGVKPVVPKADLHKVQTMEKVQKALKQPAKDQQQSLILLEEVDILFKEDKDFWTTIFKLLASSKRPFIMTCNDEDLVPLQAMSLHAVLRLAPPSANTSIDLMLLIAALEGHILKREAVASLFESKNHDLRASISELDFWCQMGVGDSKGGLSWIYQRYPPGSDVDQHGKKLRVISEDTFQDGMGLVQSGANVDDDAVLLAWRQFGVEPTSIMGWTVGSTEEQPSRSASPSTLKDMAKMADSLSAVDVYTSHATMDASQPEIPAKTRTHYIEGMALLESNESIAYSDLPAKLAISATLLTARSFCSNETVGQIRDQANLLRCIKNVANNDDAALTRRDFTCFDAISVPTSSTSTGLELSVFDGPLPAIATDLAPYVRSIAQYDLSLEEQRARLGEVMGEGHKAKKARTTRAARSALEGSQRGNTRRERWFADGLDLEATLATGGRDWPKTTAEMKEVEGREESEAPASSIGSVASTA
ncbi:hypothetical protein Q7P37_002147 [Cladosporium fusiforme]